MPKFVIHGQDSKELVRVALEDYRDGEVNLIAVDKNGNKISRGNILFLTNEGKLRLHAGVSADLGLQLDGDGRIVVEF